MTDVLRLKEVTGSLFLQARPQFYLQHHDLWHVYSLRNDPDPEMIPKSKMIPKSTPKWSWPWNDPDPEMIPTFLLVDPGVIPKELGNGD